MKKNKEKEMSEDDKALREELVHLVEILQKTSPDDVSFAESLEQLEKLIRTSTTSMTAVPKPLKYLRNSYRVLRETYERLKVRSDSVGTEKLLRNFSDILSVLALVGSSPEKRECLQYRLEGTPTKNPGDWGHEYVRQLEADIVDECLTAPIDREGETKDRLMPLLDSIVSFDVTHNAEIQACDLCLEIDELDILERQLDETSKDNFHRICNYLGHSAAYRLHGVLSEETERERILNRIAERCLKVGEYSRAILIGLQLGNWAFTEKCLNTCTDPPTRKQLAFILARQQRRQPEAAILPEEKDVERGQEEAKSIDIILSNALVNPHFRNLARELDILEPVHPEDIYKSWLVTGTLTRLLIDHYDSARANLAASFVSAFVHAGFGLDRLVSKTEDSWVYKNKEHGMLSATAALGLIHMWDVDGGLAPIDKYLYTTDDYVKSGALLAIGLVNSGVRSECDPALALLSDYLSSSSQTLRIGAVLGLGIAYAGSQRREVSDVLSSVLVDEESTLEVASLAAIALGLVNVGSTNAEVSTIILQKLLELPPTELANTHARFLPLGLGIIFLGRRDAIDAPSTALEVLPDPHKLAAQTMLQVCSYAGTGDVLIVQELLHLCSEPEFSSENTADTEFHFGETSTRAASSFDVHEQSSNVPKKAKTTTFVKEHSVRRDVGPAQAIAALGVAVVGLAEGNENSRIFGQIARYGTASARRAVPLAMALSSLSNPEGCLVDLLNKYSHDNDPDVVHSAILALGLVGAGTNNARLATMLRHLAVYSKDPGNLFLVRISEGLVHLGKGTVSLRPLRYDSKILDHTALAALIVVLVACLDCKNLILGRSHYLLYCLAVAMEPRWLVTVDTTLQPLPVSVRVGQALDITGKAGNPKVIKTDRVQTTPLLLAAGERAELVDDRYQPLSSVLEGFVVLREKSEEI